MLDIDAEVGYSRDAGLQRICLQVSPGDAVVVRGPNGVGKSTLLSTVAGIRSPLAGRVLLEGRAVSAARTKHLIGYVTDPPHLFEELTPAEHLDLVRTLWDAARVPVAGAGAAGAILEGVPDLPAGMLSLGQRKRLGLAIGIVHRPWLWVLDEPFNGLDEASILRLRGLVEDHVAGGGALLCASHDEGALGLDDVTVLQLGRGTSAEVVRAGVLRG